MLPLFDPFFGGKDADKRPEICLEFIPEEI